MHCVISVNNTQQVHKACFSGDSCPDHKFLNINNIKYLIIKINNVNFFIDTTQGGGIFYMSLT